MNHPKDDGEQNISPEIGDWTERVIKLRTEIEAAFGHSTDITSRVLATWDQQLLENEKTGQEISRKIAIQTVLTDYLINEQLNGNLSKNGFSEACSRLEQPGGMDDLYARVLLLLAGSGASFMAAGVPQAETH